MSLMGGVALSKIQHARPFAARSMKRVGYVIDIASSLRFSRSRYRPSAAAGRRDEVVNHTALIDARFAEIRLPC